MYRQRHRGSRHGMLPLSSASDFSLTAHSIGGRQAEPPIRMIGLLVLLLALGTATYVAIQFSAAQGNYGSESQRCRHNKWISSPLCNRRNIKESDQSISRSFWDGKMHFQEGRAMVQNSSWQVKDAKSVLPTTYALRDHGLCPKRKLSISEVSLPKGVSENHWETHDDATAAKYSTFAVMYAQTRYTLCDELKVRIQARNWRNENKTFGGDYFRAKIVTQNESFSAGTTTDGEIEDHGDGTYIARFTLKWSGVVKVIVTLILPSEAVGIVMKLQRASQPQAFYGGLFSSSVHNISEEVNCTFQSSLMPAKFCDLTDTMTGIPWFCQKPASDKLTCSEWIGHTTLVRVISKFGRLSVSTEERDILSRCSEDIAGLPDSIFVHENNIPDLSQVAKTLPICSTYDSTTVSGIAGFYINDNWFSAMCKFSTYSIDEMKLFMQNKTFYFFGDSTIKQLYSRLVRMLKLNEVTYGRIPELHPRSLVARDALKNITIIFHFHFLPICASDWVNVSGLNYIPNRIDTILGHGDIVLTISLWAHFQPLPEWYYQQRINSIADAAERLIQRNSRTVVIFKGANTQYVRSFAANIKTNDWYGRQKDIYMRRLLYHHPKFHFIDSWDMSSCQVSPDNLHPKEYVIENMRKQWLSFIMNKLNWSNQSNAKTLSSVMRSV